MDTSLSTSLDEFNRTLTTALLDNRLPTFGGGKEEEPEAFIKKIEESCPENRDDLKCSTFKKKLIGSKDTWAKLYLHDQLHSGD